MQTLPHATLDENTLDEMMNEVDQILGEGEIGPKAFYLLMEDVPPSSTPKRGQPAEGKENANHRTGHAAGTDGCREDRRGHGQS